MHLRVLREAGLVSARAEGTRRLYQLEPDALAALRDYLDWYWTQALESFKQHLEAERGEPMQPELKVTKSIVVDVTPTRAFEFFLDQERWWPISTHHMAEPAGETAVLEPFVGGRWYERAHDGSETDWGRVLAYEHRHLEHYGEHAEQMRTILDRPKAAEAVLHAFHAAVTAAKKPGRRSKAA